jgi:hypothetical protein
MPVKMFTAIRVHCQTVIDPNRCEMAGRTFIGKAKDPGKEVADASLSWEDDAGVRINHTNDRSASYLLGSMNGYRARQHRAR